MSEYPEDWTDDDIKQYRDVVSQIVAGLDQIRTSLGITYHELSWKRMKELAERLAMVGYDFSVFDAELIGRYLLSSSRTQVRAMEATGQPSAGAIPVDLGENQAS